MKRLAELTIGCIIILLLSSCTKRYVKILKSVYGIDIPDLQYTIEEHDEHWFLNGDGHNYVILAVEKTSDSILVALKDSMLLHGAYNIQDIESVGQIYERTYIQQILNNISPHEGYFILNKVNEDKYDLDFELLVFYVNKRKILIYYSYS